jgi:hypothetical protein
MNRTFFLAVIECPIMYDRPGKSQNLAVDFFPNPGAFLALFHFCSGDVQEDIKLVDVERSTCHGINPPQKVGRKKFNYFEFEAAIKSNAGTKPVQRI